MSPMARFGCIALALPMALVLGCAGSGNQEIRRERNPSADFGVGATILMPGQAPPMPDPDRPGSVGTGGQLTFIGGAKQRNESETRRKTAQEYSLPFLKKPAEIVAAPVVKGAEIVRNKIGRKGSRSTGGPGSGDPAATAGTPQRAPGSPGSSTAAALPPGAPHAAAPADRNAAVESARLSALERELASRPGSAVLPVPLPIPAPVHGEASASPSGSRVPAPTGRAFSIADELAMLQASLPPKTRPEDRGRRVSPSRPDRPAPPAAGVADEVSDRDGDGMPDHWIYRHEGRIVRELFDEDGDSAPDRTVYYDPRTGEKRSVEEDTDLDGRLDSWVEFRGGKMARQRRDTDHDGFLDTWTFYRDGQLAREEQDRNGDGFRDRMAFYEEGHLAREREDRDGDGRVDRVTLYDVQERIRQRDEDQDGDGRIDTRSYYEEGRLTRRELLEEALQESVDRETLSEPQWSEGPPDSSGPAKEG